MWVGEEVGQYLYAGTVSVCVRKESGVWDGEGVCVGEERCVCVGREVVRCVGRCLSLAMLWSFKIISVCTVSP